VRAPGGGGGGGGKWRDEDAGGLWAIGMGGLKAWARGHPRL